MGDDLFISRSLSVISSMQAYVTSALRTQCSLVSVFSLTTMTGCFDLLLLLTGDSSETGNLALIEFEVSICSSPLMFVFMKDGLMEV